MRKVKSRKIANDYYLELEDSLLHGTLIEIKTSKEYKKEITEKIRSEISFYNDKPARLSLRKALVDVAIVVYVPRWRFEVQDLDNIAKVVLDAISKDKKDLKQPYLIENDSQVIRLLLYKKERKEHSEFETSQLSISMREHDPDKEMRLVRKEVI